MFSRENTILFASSGSYKSRNTLRSEIINHNLTYHGRIGRICLSYIPNKTKETLEDLEKVYWALESELTPFIVKTLKEELNKSKGRQNLD
jgi:hypothetical protein